MTKSQKIALNTITLIVGNILFWICNIYPRHILEISSVYSLIAIFLNLIYFVIFDYFLIIVFSQNKAFFSKEIFDITLPVIKRFKIWKLVTLLFMQIIVDGLILLLNKTAAEWAYIGIDVLIVLHWFAIYAFLANKAVAIWKLPRVFRGVLGNCHSFPWCCNLAGYQMDRRGDSACPKIRSRITSFNVC